MNDTILVSLRNNLESFCVLDHRVRTGRAFLAVPICYLFFTICFYKFHCLNGHPGQASSQVLRFGGAKYIFRGARFLFLLYF